tara:strand:- start:276 stop:6254 length:5979 start_codon:yes stop_codon:yes gene_type:complete
MKRYFVELIKIINKLCNLYIVFILIFNAHFIFANTGYQLQSVIDSGGGPSEIQGKNAVYQSVGPVFHSVTVKNDLQVVNGNHFSSVITQVDGFLEDFEREDVTINATVLGLTNLEVEFEARSLSNVYQFSNRIDNDFLDSGWMIVWDSLENLTDQEVYVTFNSRVFDGLTWSKWYQATRNVVVDNLYPVFDEFFLSNNKFSPSNASSIGIADTITTFFDVEETFLDNYFVNVFDDQDQLVRQFFNGSVFHDLTLNQFNQVWDGLNSSSDFEDDGYYKFEIVVQDSAGNTTAVNDSFLLDDQSPTIEDIVLSTVGQELNSELGNLSLIWDSDDNFDTQVSHNISYQYVDFEIKDIDGLYLWLDVADLFSVDLINTDKVTLLADKSFTGNHFLQSNSNFSPTLVSDNYVSFDVIEFDQFDDVLRSSENFEANTTYYLYFVIHRDSGWEILEDTLVSTTEGKLSIGLNQASTFSNFRLAEFVVFSDPLSVDDRTDLLNYFNFKWTLNIEDDWNFDQDNLLAETWSKNSLPDSSYFRIKVKGTDHVGNNFFQYSNVAFTPDRTAPEIASTFTDIYATEDITVIYDPSEFELDNYSSHIGLTWDAELISTTDDPTKASDVLLEAINEVNNEQQVELVPGQHRNTFSTADGNVFGLDHPAFVDITLFDQQGNFTSKQIQVNVQAINDVPVFIADIGDSISYDSYNDIIYNIRFNEDTISNPLTLDDYVLDVDNDKEDLVFTVLNNDYYLLGNIQSDAKSYESTFLNVDISEASSEHQIVFTPSLNFYGDKVVSINVQDPGGLFSQQDMVVRIWPVNDPPIIADVIQSLEISNEDNAIQVTLTDFEDDVFLEDVAPTYNHLLNWTVESLSDIVTLDTSLSNSDTFTFNAEENFYGTINFVVRLTDTDTVAEGVFPPGTEYGGYTAQPLSVTHDFTVVWTPVNDAPVPLDIPDQIQQEDYGLWVLDLSTYKQDIEDTGLDLKWELDLDSNFVTHTYDPNLNQISFQTVQDGFGKMTVGLTLTDTDENINFQPYTPNPLTVQHSFVLELSPVNDAPSLDGVSINSTVTGFEHFAVSEDTFKVRAVGFRDIGVENGQVNSELGNEYDASIVGEDFGGVEYQTNSILYDYHWYVDGNLIQSEIDSTSSTNFFTVIPSYQGKTVTVEVQPNDSDLLGTVQTDAFVVNILPNNIDQTLSSFSPTLNFYTNTGNVTVTWGAVSDQNVDDEIVYRLGIWQTDKFETIAMDTMTLDSQKFYDSGWFSGFDQINLEEIISGFTHGAYFWRIWTGNLFANENTTYYYDTGDPGWFSMFNVDFISPSFNVVEEYLSVSEIGINAVIEDAGNSRILYGAKPEDTDDRYFYQILLYSENTLYDEDLGYDVVVTDSRIIVEFTNETQWQYELTYPSGRTYYQVVLEDLATNTTTLNTFTITEDETPPYGFDLFGQVLTNYTARVSSNYILLSGSKEAEAAIYYSGLVDVDDGVSTNVSQIVGYTDSTTFTLPIFPDKESGYLYTVDRSGNIADQTTYVDIEFVIGPPSVNRSALNKEMYSIIENEQTMLDFGFSSSHVGEFTTVSFDISSDRLMSSYQLLNASGNLLTSGSNVALGTTENISFQTSSATLVDGVNDMTLRVYDDLYNVYEEQVTINIHSDPPNTDVITLAAIENITVGSFSYWQLQVYGNVEEGVTVFVNDNPVNTNDSGHWFYNDPNFSPDSTNVNVLFIDEIYNASYVSLWDYSYYSYYSALSDISLPISEVDQIGSSIALTYAYLPDSIKDLFLEEYYPSSSGPYGLYTPKMSVNNDLDLSYISIEDSDISIPESLRKKIYKIYAKDLMGDQVEDLELSEYKVKAKFEYPDAYDYDVDDLVVLRLDNEQEKWVQVPRPIVIDTHNSMLSISIDQTGIYSLAELNVFQKNLESFRVYPNPWSPNDSQDLTGDSTGITFDQLTDDTTIKIYTLSGELVIETTTSTSWVWDGNNTFGNPVFSGIYLYVIESAGERLNGKLTVIR